MSESFAELFEESLKFNDYDYLFHIDKRWEMFEPIIKNKLNVLINFIHNLFSIKSAIVPNKPLLTKPSL